MRVGIGYDVHKLVEDRDLIIGGVKIDHDRGLLGHSDAETTEEGLGFTGAREGISSQAIVLLVEK